MTNSSHKTMAEEAKDEASAMAEDIRDKVTDRARTEAENLRNAAADETQKAANAAEAAASEFDPNSLQARAIDQLATRIEDIARDIRGVDIDRMARTLRSAAQRNPLMFVAGAAVAGFALTRFLAARPPERSRRRYSDVDPWADDDLLSPVHDDRHSRTPDLTPRGGV